MTSHPTDTISFYCIHCRRKVNVPWTQIGQQVSCDLCKAWVQVPVPTDLDQPEDRLISEHTSLPPGQKPNPLKSQRQENVETVIGCGVALAALTVLLFLCIPLIKGCNQRWSEHQRQEEARDHEIALKLVGRERLRKQLRDPDSLEIIEERLIRPGLSGGEVGYFAKYRAKNGFGGYVVDEFYTE